MNRPNPLPSRLRELLAAGVLTTGLVALDAAETHAMGSKASAPPAKEAAGEISQQDLEVIRNLEVLKDLEVLKNYDLIQYQMMLYGGQESKPAEEQGDKDKKGGRS